MGPWAALLLLLALWPPDVAHGAQPPPEEVLDLPLAPYDVKVGQGMNDNNFDQGQGF